MPSRRTDIDDEEVRFMSKVEGMSLREIAKHFNTAASTIYGRLHPEKQKETSDKWRLKNLEKAQENNVNFRLENPDYDKQHYQDNREKELERVKKYQETENGKVKIKEYRQSDKGKIARSKVNCKRRCLGHELLNKWFPCSEGHHPDEYYVIYIPGEIHRFVSHDLKTGKGMEDINEISEAWMIYEKLLVGKSVEEQKVIIDKFVDNEIGILEVNIILAGEK
ncbi:hypothetical protein KAX02_08170 [candidate division WOR-3 bacterium]|nr:hypothetical protein [candidate division WOR-3 bacterium]